MIILAAVAAIAEDYHFRYSYSHRELSLLKQKRAIKALECSGHQKGAVVLIILTAVAAIAEDYHCSCSYSHTEFSFLKHKGDIKVLQWYDEVVIAIYARS